MTRGDWQEALHRATDAIQRSLAIGHVKDEVLGLGTRAQALHALGRTKDAITDLRQAVALAQPVGDPALLLRAAVPLLTLAGDDALAAEARQAAEPVRLLQRMTR